MVLSIVLVSFWIWEIKTFFFVKSQVIKSKDSKVISLLSNLKFKALAENLKFKLQWLIQEYNLKIEIFTHTDYFVVFYWYFRFLKSWVFD